MNDCTIPPSTAPRLGREIRIKIGRQLRAMYADLVRQGVPASFIDLLDRLDERAGAAQAAAQTAEQKARG